MAADKKIMVVGAGPAGLVAAINLARTGFTVTVVEKEDKVGGNPEWHPSAHATPLKGPETWEYIGIDCTPCFVDCSERCDVYLNEQKLPLKRIPQGLWVCERGGRESSLDSHLYRIALGEGVRFEFGRSITTADLPGLPPNTILATGFTPAMYGQLNMPSGRYAGYHAFLGHPAADYRAAIYFGGLGKEYGYSSAINGLWYALLFTRNELPAENLNYFAGMMQKYEGKKIAGWRQFFGAVPKNAPQLFLGDRFILAGSLAGFIETNLGFGITGALISGKIAALAVSDRAKAQAEFDSFTAGIAQRLEQKKKGQAGIAFQMGKIWFKI